MSGMTDESIGARRPFTGAEPAVSAAGNPQGRVLGCFDEHCRQCGRVLTPLEIALHRKLVNRGATEFLCKTCLARLYKLTEADLDRMAQVFKAQGCTLFL